MIDRKVRQISPKPTEGESGEIQKFSLYVDTSNIVLLGDPGSGKTHLLSNAANGHTRIAVVVLDVSGELPN
jgi:DNA replication protein DnaC